MLRQFVLNFYRVGHLLSVKNYVTWICRPQHVVGGPPGCHMGFPNAFCKQTKLYASHMYSFYSDIYISFCDT